MGRITRTLARTAAHSRSLTKPVTEKVGQTTRNLKSDYLDARADIMEHKQTKSLERRNKANLKRAKAAAEVLEAKVADAKRLAEPIGERSADLAANMKNLLKSKPTDEEMAEAFAALKDLPPEVMDLFKQTTSK